MSFHEDLEDMKELVRMVISDKKEEKERKERARKTVQIVCPFCGVSSRVIWEEGRLPVCPSCGASLEENDPQLEKIRADKARQMEIEDKAREVAAIDSAKLKNKIRRYIIIGVIVLIILIAAVIIAGLNGGSLHITGDGSFHLHVGPWAIHQFFILPLHLLQMP